MYAFGFFIPAPLFLFIPKLLIYLHFKLFSVLLKKTIDMCQHIIYIIDMKANNTNNQEGNMKLFIAQYYDGTEKEVGKLNKTEHYTSVKAFEADNRLAKMKRAFCEEENTTGVYEIEKSDKFFVYKAATIILSSKEIK